MFRARIAALALVVLWLLLVAAGTSFGQETDTEGEAIQQGFQGTLTVDGRALADVGLELAELDGTQIATTTTAEDGSWSFAAPRAGRFRLLIDADTLPEGVTVANEAFLDREVGVRSGQVRSIRFRLSSGETPGGSTATTTADDADVVSPAEEATGEIDLRKGAPLSRRLLDAVNNGVKLGCIVAMASIGLSLIFGTTGLVNFAHGELVTFGAVVAWFLNVEGPELWLIWAAVLATLIAAAFGFLLERGLWRPVEKRAKGSFQLLVISIGLSLVLRHVIQLWFGVDPQRYVDYTNEPEISIGPFDDTARDFAIIAISIVILVLVGLGVKYTRLGKAMRAVSDDRDLAESSGIDVKGVISFIWAFGTALAAIGGIMLGATTIVDDDMGFRLLLLMFAAIILGGLGTAYGAMAGGLAIGLAIEVTTVWLAPELKNVWALVLLISILLVRPQGILGVKERIG